MIRSVVGVSSISTPLVGGWLIVDGVPMFHRFCESAGHGSAPVVHVHGLAISGTYLEPTAALLADRYRTYVPDLPGMGRSMATDGTADVNGLARSLRAYCDAVGIDRAAFVGNSLGCHVIVEFARLFPQRISNAVLVSPVGGPHNRPLARVIVQMVRDALREPRSLLPIAVGDYLRCGVLRSWSMFRGMVRYPLIERLAGLSVPALVVVGRRDPLVRRSRAQALSTPSHVDAVEVAGAHALNFSSPDVIAQLAEAHIAASTAVTTSRNEQAI